MRGAGDLELEAGPLEGVPGAALVRVSGKGGLFAVKRLQEAVQPLLEAGTAKFLFDCARLESLNSTALGYLINLADRAKEAGGALAFCRVPKKVQVAFDLLGLRDFFGFFADEAGAAASLGAGAAPPAHRAPVIAALPAWLEEVDRPAAPSLDHPRWAVLAQTAAERIGPAGLAEVCGRLGVPAGGPRARVLREILRRLRSPRELLALFDERTLEGICRLYHIPPGKGKDRLISEIVALVGRSSTETLAGFLKKDAEAAPVEFVELPVEITGDNLLRTLENGPLFGRPKNGRAARDLVSRRLAGVFGRGKVAVDVAVGRRVTAKADLEVAGRFGVVVRLAGKGTAPREVPALLGQLVLLGKRYGEGNLFVLLVGELPAAQAPALDEVRGLMERAGARFVHLR